MSRLDTRLRRPPVRIGLAQARVQAEQLLNDSQQTVLGAGDYGMREARFASVPLRLRIDKGGVSPNQRAGVEGVLPIGRTHRKAGYPELTETTLFPNAASS